MGLKSGGIRNLLRLFLLVLSFAAPCAAQTTPAWELFGGYSFERSDVREYYKSTPIVYAFRGQYVNLRGWEVAVSENLNRWFGGTLVFSGHYKSPQLLGTTNRLQKYSILYGPRFSLRTPWIIPFAHFLIGVDYVTVKVTPVGPHASDVAFVMAPGGGLDVKLGGKAAIRVFQAEYLRTDPLGTRHNNFRVSSGVVFYLDKRK